MGRIIKTQTNFSSGELTPDLFGRGDVAAYDNGASVLENVFISTTGGIKRRSGTVFVATLPSYVRLIAYEYTSDQTYVLAVGHTFTTIYLDGVFQTTITTPWTSAQIDQINSAQTADAIYITHPDIPPKKITRSSTGTWSISDITWNTNGNLSLQPYYKFASSDVSLFSFQTSGTATISASAPIFTASYVGVRLRIRTTECTITGFTNATTVTATVHGTLAANPATFDWKEQAFSTLRGYPVAISFYQDRTIFGGSKSLPNRLWLSKSGDAFNFDLGTGLDDDAIEFGILSDQINAVRGLISGRHLQVFCSGAEFMVTGDPLTPTNIQIKRQTRIGSTTDRAIPPIDIDGATMFINRTRTEIREFLYTDLEQAYRATDVAFLTRNMITGAVDQDFDKIRRLLFVVREDGTFSTLTLYRAENITAWTRHTTNGSVKSCIVAGSIVYLQIYRNGAYLLEELRDDVFLDSSVMMTNVTPQTVWSGLSHLNGMSVYVLADNIPQGPFTVSSGSITLTNAAQSVHIGLSYTHTIKPMPVNLAQTTQNLSKIRLISSVLKLQNSYNFMIDTGNGPRSIILNTSPPFIFSGNYTITGYGWSHDVSKTLWTITGNQPLAFNLLSITTQTQVN